MREAGEVEIAAELAVDAREQIEIEGGGDAARIVIGGDQDPLGLLQIDAEQEGAARPEQPRGIAEEGARLVMGQIADGRAGEEAEPGFRRAHAAAASRVAVKSAIDRHGW